MTEAGRHRAARHARRAMRAVRFRLGAHLQRRRAALRRRYYSADRKPRWVRAPSPRWQRRLGLDDPLAIGSRKLEIGCGPYPRPRYLHVDFDPEFVMAHFGPPLLIIVAPVARSDDVQPARRGSGKEVVPSATIATSAGVIGASAASGGS